MNDLIDIAKGVCIDESKAIKALADKIDNNFVTAVNLILQSRGRVVITGMGKSGLIGQKISASFSSTGTSSFFIHPAEALHGDLGMVMKGDVVIAISNSGETDEILRLLPCFKKNGNKIIAFCGRKKSSLAKNSDCVLDISVEKEVCPLDLAPSSSTTAGLVMGDALMVALMKERNFNSNDFALNHPGGTLGKRLVISVEELMRVDNLPLINENSNIKDCISVISGGMLGLAVVINDRDKVVGIISDGDLRRSMERENFFSLLSKDIMTSPPKSIPLGTKLIEAENIMHKYKILSLLVTENDNLKGILQLYDLKKIKQER